MVLIFLKNTIFVPPPLGASVRPHTPHDPCYGTASRFSCVQFEMPSNNPQTQFLFWHYCSYLSWLVIAAVPSSKEDSSYCWWFPLSWTWQLPRGNLYSRLLYSLLSSSRSSSFLPFSSIFSYLFSSFCFVHFTPALSAYFRIHSCLFCFSHMQPPSITAQHPLLPFSAVELHCVHSSGCLQSVSVYILIYLFNCIVLWS